MTRAGFVAVIGAPNAGKSTLVNRLVGTKVSIVTQKVQTTRFPVRGVAIEGETQMVLVDTPGIFTARRRLDRAMIHAAWGGVQGADAVVHLVDAQAQILVADGQGKAADRKAVQDVKTITEGLKSDPRTTFLAMNKIDLVKQERLLDLAQTLFDSRVYGRGLHDLRRRRGRDRRPQTRPGRPDARGSVVLSGRSERRYSGPPAGRGDHPREGLSAGARRTSLRRQR